jgi:hypothetical protein
VERNAIGSLLYVSLVDDAEVNEIGAWSGAGFTKGELNNSQKLSLLPLRASALPVLSFRCVALYAAAIAMRTEDPDVPVSMHGGTECLVGHR